MWEGIMPDIDFASNDFGVIKINGIEIKEVEEVEDEQETEKKSRN